MKAHFMEPLRCSRMKMKNQILCLTVLFCLSVFARSDVVDPSRRITWAAGVPGGVPIWPTAINVKNAPYNAKGDGVSDDTAAINAALVNCAAGSAVLLPAGNYFLSNTITIKKAKVLRVA